MGNLLLVLFLTIGSVVLGLVLQAVFKKKSEQVRKISKYLKIGTIFFLNPVSMLISFWTFSLSGKLIIFPFLGISLPIINGAFSILLTKKMHIEPSKAASVFAAGTFSNIQTFGGLTAFVLFGSDGYSLMMLFNIFISLITYFIGYPVSGSIANGGNLKALLKKTPIRKQLYLFLPLIAFVAGLILNYSGVQRPEAFGTVKNWIIPISTASLGISAGLTINLSKTRKPEKEVLLICLIKFVLSPATMALICLAAGMNSVMGGLPMIIAVIAAAMPVGFNALVPPVVYGFDIDIANSAWVISTLFFIVVLSVVFIAA